MSDSFFMFLRLQCAFLNFGSGALLNYPMYCAAEGAA